MQRYFIHAGEYPALVLDSGQYLGSIIRWNGTHDGLAVTAGNINRTYLLTPENCDLAQVKHVLAGLVSA